MNITAIRYAGWLLLTLALGSCGGGTRPDRTTSELAEALSQGNPAIIRQHMNTPGLSPVARQLIRMRLLQLENRPLPMTAISRQLADNYPRMSPARQDVLKSLALWAAAWPIYRQEIGRKVRILQREKLYLAPSRINLAACVQESSGCANALRHHLRHFTDTETLNAMLMDMARRDPCINLTDQLQSDAKAHRCLSKQMGELAVDLLPTPTISAEQWQQALGQ